MANLAVPCLLIAAGAAIVGQNFLMSMRSGNSSTILIPLILNSAVGFTLLFCLLIWREGAAGLSEIAGAIRPWSVLPGLLGSFFVFASIVGYSRFGAAATIAILVSSQLAFGLVVDLIRSGGAGS